MEPSVQCLAPQGTYLCKIKILMETSRLCNRILYLYPRFSTFILNASVCYFTCTRFHSLRANLNAFNTQTQNMCDVSFSTYGWLHSQTHLYKIT